MRLGIIGARSVGRACAFAAATRGSAREIVLVHRWTDRRRGILPLKASRGVTSDATLPPFQPAFITVFARSVARRPPMQFIMSLNWTDQGIRTVKESPKRARAARELASKVGVEIKEVYLTSGENDLILLLETQSGDNAAKFALALGSLGNVRTKTARAWSETEYQKLVAELP
jgi:uncharacterized protein with GYD domain